MADQPRILQLSDPHLLADPAGLCRDRPALTLLRHGVGAALAELRGAGTPPDLLLISGDLCQDESWGGYVLLRDLIAELDLPVALLAGNHDHGGLLRAALGRSSVIAPACLALAGWRLLLLESHRPGEVGGWLGEGQMRWLERQLDGGEEPVLVAVHHPPVPIGDPMLDSIALHDGAALMDLLHGRSRVRGLVFGHVHQHWQGELPWRADVPLLGCPSTLRSFGPVQPCPLGRPDDPGGRLLELMPDGEIRHRLLRWDPPAPPTFG